MSITQCDDLNDATSDYVLLSNLTTGEIWEPLTFLLNRVTSVMTRSRKKDLPTVARDGLAENVTTIANGILSQRVIAIYLVRDVWTFFDGEAEYPLIGLSSPSVFGVKA